MTRGTTEAAKGGSSRGITIRSRSASSSSLASGEVAAGMAWEGHSYGAPLGRPSRISGPKPGGQAAEGCSSGRDGPLMPLPPRCGAVPPPLPPKWADGEDGARMAARGNTSDGDPFPINDATAVAITDKVDDMGQENNDHFSNNGVNNEDNDKWGRGTLFNLSSTSLSFIVSHLVSDAIAAAGLLLSGIMVPRIDAQHRDSLRPNRRRASGQLTKR
jgi:hypothetical protein